MNTLIVSVIIKLVDILKKGDFFSQFEKGYTSDEQKAGAK